MRIRTKTLWLGLALAAFGQLAAAQEITGTITGTVTDESGAALPGVAVVVRNVDTGDTRQFISSGTGAYTASFLPVGSYDLSFQISGFQTLQARSLRLHVNDRLKVDAMLKVGEISEQIEVTAERLIQPTPAVQSLMGPVQIEELALNNRNFIQLATLVPGVSSDLPDEVGVGLTSITSISINGARRNAVNWLVDGASNVDVGSNVTLLATPTLESIEEFKIITSSYAAEWPRSGGGVVNVVTKSGTNDFRFSGYEFFRNDKLNANTYFRNQSTNPEVAGKPPRLRYNNFGYTAGGPIMKDRLFFFWSQEWRQISRASASVTANVIDPAWLTDPNNPNYVPPAERDPIAVSLLSAWPAPNLGSNRFISSTPAEQDTRQEVMRLDYNLNSSWRLMGRYTHDLSQTEEPGGLFFNSPVPGVATTRTAVPGHVFVAQITATLSPNTLNEFTYQLSGNEISTGYSEGARNKKSDYGISTGELFADNANGLIPILRVGGLATPIGANQLVEIKYRNHTLADNLTLQRGNHSFKVGALVTLESKDENAANATQGDFTFAAGGGRNAFQNFLRGNRDGLCGAPCFYTESEIDITNHLRFNRYEAYVQDSWRVRPRLTLDVGLRYSLFPGVTDENDVLTSFSPALYNPSNVPRFSSAAGTAVIVGTGDPLNGIVVAGRNAPNGRRLYETEKNNIAPRVGFTWDPFGGARTQLRGGYGIYYDQPLVGIFEQNAFVNPPFANSVTLLNPSLANPASGIAPNTRGVRNLIASSDPFKTPRTMQWNVGITRQLYERGVVDVSYVGARGDNLIRPVDINLPQPEDVVRLGSQNLARPYLGYGTITMRQTTARSRYHGLLVSFRHDAGRAGTFNLAYTLSRNKTDSTNDRDAVDLPQNPLDLEAEYALARTDRTHIFTANYVYELPFFRNGAGLAKAVLGGWQLAGITTFQSGPPISRLETINTGAGRKGGRVSQLSDPFAGVPSDRYFINPAAFAPPADGLYGNTGRAFFRLPGRNQWDLTLSKNWYPSGKARVQFRADFINALNHTQLTTIDRICRATATDATCAIPNGTFGLFDGVRAPREIQLGIKLYWK
jgi:outer membrane receptor protein involved in Fe transport